MSTPVLKLGLKRVSLDDRIFSDEELRASSVVRLLGEAAVRDLLAQSTGRRFADQSRLFLEGDAGDALMFLLKGEARLFAGAGRDMVEVAVARKGEVVGEREALGDGPARAFTAQAVGEVEVLEISRALLGQLAPRGSALERHLRQVADGRSATRGELTAFLNRW